MKSFFATAIIAALATAGDWNMVCDDNDCYWVETADVRGDFEDAIEEIGRALEDLQNADIGEMEREMESEIEREIERTMEDLECWWADRNNGNGECAMRTRRAEEEACW